MTTGLLALLRGSGSSRTDNMSDSTRNNEDLPPIPRALLEALERQTLPFKPSLDWSERKIFHEIGRRSYLEWLRLQFDRQQKGPSVLN